MDGSTSGTSWRSITAVGGSLVLTFAMLTLQGWLTLSLFGPRPWHSLCDEQPILSGQHALHQLHGELGARAWRTGSSCVVYDPTFQAGYPKTPWFDAECRPAELFILLGGKHNAALTWKFGVALTWLLIPVVTALTALIAGASRGATLVALFLGILFSWSEPTVARLHAGDLATVMGSLLLLLWIASLTALRRTTSASLWLLATLCLSGALFMVPLYFFLVLPSGLAFLFRVGPKQSYAWLGWFVTAFMVAIGLNLGTLRDACLCSWLLSDLLPAESLPAVAIAWDWLSRFLRFELLPLAAGLGLFSLGLLGLWYLRRQQPGGVFRGWFVLLVMSVSLGVLGPLWPVVDRFEPAKLSFLGLLLTIVPAAVALVGCCHAARHLARAGSWALLPLGAMIAFSSACVVAVGLGAWRQATLPSTLVVGFRPDEELLIAKLRDHTKTSARILWEDTPDSLTWSPWLAKLTGRSCLGGLTTRTTLDCFWHRLGQGQLAGKMLEQWTPAGFEHYCQRANVGWVVVRTAPTLLAMEKLAAIRTRLPLPLGFTLLELDRPHAFVLKGQGRLEIHEGHVTLCEVTPDEGEVIVSLHYVHGLHATLNRVRLEPLQQKDDPLPLLRLKLSGPVSQVTLYCP